MAATTSTSEGDTSRDVPLYDPPSDGISELRWSPRANYLAVSSWDCSVRIYDMSRTLEGQAPTMIGFGGPVLSCDWSPDGSVVVGAGLDGTARMLDLASGALAQVAAHTRPIKSDTTVAYWAARQVAPACVIPLAERVYSMNVRETLLVAATADNKCHRVDLRLPQAIQRSADNGFFTETRGSSEQARVVTCRRDGTGWAVGGVGGRCHISNFSGKDSGRDWTFACHRRKQGDRIDIYTVNDIQFHPMMPQVMSTAGSDGKFFFWDLDIRRKLQTFPSVGGTINSTSWNLDGSLFAYGVSYDWSTGCYHNTPDLPIRVMIHPVTEDELKLKT